MNDFLHSLRTGKDKRYDRSRRGHDNSPYRSNDRHGGNDRRKRGNYNKSNVAENAYLTIAKLLPPVKSLLETLVSERKDFLEVEKRKAMAMESIAGYLKKIAGSNDDGSLSQDGHERQDISDQISISDPAMITEESSIKDAEPVSLMKELRAQGLSYDKIARQLELENIPTPSGRGAWRGQTVSKLLKQSEPAD